MMHICGMLERYVLYNYFDDSKKNIVSVGAVLGLFVLLPFLEPLWMEATSN